MLWTTQQQAAARLEHWELVDTVDNGSNKPILRIFGLRGVSNHKAQRHVAVRASKGSALHIEALRAIARSTTYKHPKKAKA